MFFDGGNDVVLRAQDGVFGDHVGTAVSVGEDGCLVGADVFGFVDDFLFVKPDERAEDECARALPDDVHGCDDLAADLGEAVANDECFGVFFIGDVLCYLEHEAFVEDHAVVFWDSFHEFVLDVLEGYEVKFGVVVIGGEDFCEVFDFGE